MKKGFHVSVGIDMGGTNLRLGLVSREGLVGRIHSVRTDTGSGPEAVIDQIREGMEKVLGAVERDVPVVSVGLGVPGPLNIRTGVVATMPNVPGWEEYPLREILEKRIGRPVILMNDADAAGYGEHYYGMARDTDTFAVLTLGTGLGSSLFLRGEAWTGATGFSSELGHIPMGRGGPKCSCGRRGHLESYVSSRRLVERVQAALDRGRGSTIDPEQLRRNQVQEIARRAREGDRLALEELRRYGRYLGKGLATLANLLNLPVVILAGGILPAWDLIESSAVRELDRQAFRDQAGALQIRISRLEDSAGVLGAGGYALRQR